jgi:hypothetical protein
MAVSLVSTGVTFPDSSTQTTAATGFGFKNRIINGAMVIDQRNAGASGTALAYTVDRWSFSANLSTKGTWQQNAGAVTPPASFSNYLGFTSNSAYSVAATDYFLFRQRIEGFNFADFSWGTANAKAATVSFWVRSSLTGTFAVAFTNSDGNRSYPATYTITAANTWEQKSITIPGDTTGTWVGATTGIGVTLDFAMGVGSTFSGTANAWSAGTFVSATGATSVVGTNGATFYVTGVQLEKGSTATSFDYRPYTTELQLAQRYCYAQVSGGAAFYNFGTSSGSSTTGFFGMVKFPVTMRATPSSITASAGNTFFADPGIVATTVTIDQLSPNQGAINFTGATGMTSGFSGRLLANNTALAYIIWNAEL